MKHIMFEQIGDVITTVCLSLMLKRCRSLTVSKTVVRLIKRKRKMLSHYSLLLTKAKIISAPTTPVMILFLGRLVRTWTSL